VSDKDHPSPEQEGQFHTYVTSRIPWWMRLIWVGFWVFAICYFVAYVVPASKYIF
jgi:hypothetical protein